MTTIVAVRKNGRACLAGDTLTSHGGVAQRAHFVVEKSKLMRVGDTFIGLTGSCAHEQVLRSYFAEYGEAADFSSTQRIYETWRRMHHRLKDEYGLNTSEGRDDPYESSQIYALVLNPSGIFEICSMRSVSEIATYWAIGSGSDFALGAMHACYGVTDDVEAIARAGIEAAAEFDKSTGLPLTMHTLELDWVEPPPPRPLSLLARAAWAGPLVQT